jgi:hypothetical protein
MNNNPATASALSGVFVNSIASMNNGEVVNDIDDALRQAVRASLASAKKSRVTIKLDIVPAGEGVGGTPLFKVVDDIEVKLPKKQRSKSPVFFADDDCNLTRRNPKQDEMKLEALDGGKVPALGAGQAKAASQ